MNKSSRNKKVILSLVGIMVLIGAIVGGFAFNELLNVDAKDRLVAKISSYQIKEMNDRMNSVVEEWKNQGIFKISKKELINELREIESSAKEGKKELESVVKFLDEYRVEGAKYSKVPSYSSYEALLAKLEASVKNNDFKEMKEDKEKVSEGLEILKKEEEDERERVEAEERRKTEELAEAKRKEKEAKKKAEKLKKEKKERENNEKRTICENYTLDFLNNYIESVNNNNYYPAGNYIEYGSQADGELNRMVNSYYDKNKSARLNDRNLLSSSIKGNECKVIVEEWYTIYDRDEPEYKDELPLYQKMEYTWIVDGEDGYYNALLRNVKVLKAESGSAY